MEKDLLDSFNVNVIGVVKTINTFMPLIQKSAIKKVITISTGMADPDLVNSFEIDNAAPYAISKSATNMTIAKYNALYKKDGVLFLAISPGLVDTGHNLREFKCRLSSEGRTSQLLLLTQRFGNSAARSSDDPQIRGIRAALQRSYKC